MARIAAVAPVVATSSVYETPPVGPPQPNFLNAAVCVEWAGDLHALLDALLRIERELGRVRRERWGPRTIDLDILFALGPEVHSERLDVPHPRVHERAFALLPLKDVMPEAFEKTLRALDDAAIQKTSFTLA